MIGCDRKAPQPRRFQFRFRLVGRRRPGLWGARSRGADPGREVSHAAARAVRGLSVPSSRAGLVSSIPGPGLQPLEGPGASADFGACGWRVPALTLGPRRLSCPGDLGPPAPGFPSSVLRTPPRGQPRSRGEERHWPGPTR